MTVQARPRLVASSTSVVVFADVVGVEVQLALDAPPGMSAPPLGVDSVVMRIHDLSSLGPDADVVVDGVVAAGMTPLVPVLTVAAAALGADLLLDGPVCPTAVAGGHAANRLAAEWFGDPIITIEATATTDGPTLPQPPTGRGLLYTRGLDSTAVLLTMEAAGDSPTHLISMDWVDPPYAGDVMASVWRATAAAAAERGLPLVRITTDARRLLDPLVEWERAFVPVLAGPSLALAGILRSVGVSSTYRAGNAEFYGSHEALDPLWSSAAVTIEHRTDVPGDRTDRAAILLRDPWAVRWLQVCWEHPEEGNCGRCRKCLRTMSELWVAGADEADLVAFAAPLRPDAVRALREAEPHPFPRNTLELVARLQTVVDGQAPVYPVARGGDASERAFAAELLAAWEDVLHLVADPEHIAGGSGIPPGVGT